MKWKYDICFWNIKELRNKWAKCSVKIPEVPRNCTKVHYLSHCHYHCRTSFWDPLLNINDKLIVLMWSSTYLVRLIKLAASWEFFTLTLKICCPLLRGFILNSCRLVFVYKHPCLESDGKLCRCRGFFVVGFLVCLFFEHTLLGKCKICCFSHFFLCLFFWCPQGSSVIWTHSYYVTEEYRCLSQRANISLSYVTTQRTNTKMKTHLSTAGCGWQW